MKQSFEGRKEAVDFAMSEATKRNKKLSVFLVKVGGIKYVVADSEELIKGKLLNEFGKDPVMKPFVLPPIVWEEKKEEIPAWVEEYATVKTESVTLETPPEEVEIIEEEVKVEKLKKAKKKKEDNG